MGATKGETCRGSVWTWLPHSAESFCGLRAAEYEVRSVAEKKVAVILCQDGVAGYEEEALVYEDDDDEAGDEVVEDELVKRAKDLLHFRWEKMRLMDAIVSRIATSPDGDYKGCITAAFKSVDEEVQKRVKSMPHEMGKKILDWNEPIVWQAQYNTVVVIVTPEEVYMAGSGSFAVRVISKDGVSRISSLANLCVSSAKCGLAGGVPVNEETKVAKEILAQQVKHARESTVENTFTKYQLKEEDQCIIVEQNGSCSISGVKEWLGHGKDWGAALTALSGDVWPMPMHFDAVVLELERPGECNRCLLRPSSPPQR